MAYVVTNRAVDAAELWQWCEGRIPAFAVPRFIRVVESMPKTPSERVQKAELRKLGITADTHDRLAGAAVAGAR
jgi:crotonobetaine/carnitine-CoA ligase